MLGHYLMFNRDCQEALRTYEEAFGAKVLELQTYGNMPPNPAFPIAEEDKSLVLHARLQIDGAQIQCADASGRSAPGDNMYVSYTSTDVAAVQKAWDVLREGGQVYMELAPSFFAVLHGSLRDRHGISWMFSAMKA